jgi:ribosomal-protein-alanine N-acetyltransferase
MRKPIEESRLGEPVRSGRFLVRRMRGDDLEAVMVIERAAFKHPWSTELFRRELTHDWSTILLAIEQEPGPLEGPPRLGPEKIIGFVIFWLVHDEIHVLNVAVDPTQRRRGVGRALLAETVGRARKIGAQVMTLEVRRSNAPAINLYKSLGFRPVGIRPNYYVDEGEDAIVMVLDL